MNNKPGIIRVYKDTIINVALFELIKIKRDVMKIYFYKRSPCISSSGFSSDDFHVINFKTIEETEKEYNDIILALKNHYN